MRQSFFLLSTASMLLGLAAFAPAASASALLPHRAVYDLELKDASDRSGITALKGRMVYEFNGSACEGFTTTFRYVTQIDNGEQVRLTDQQTTTFEAGDGSAFRFLTKSYVDKQLDTETVGNASLDKDGVKVDLKKPKEEKLELAATQFPTQHLIELLKKAQGGETFYETSIFDGSDDANKILSTTVIIGKDKPTATATGVDDEAPLKDLKTAKHWPVSMSYFEDEKENEGLPVYQIAFKLYDNGITRDLVMDYGDFSMTGKLVDLKVYDTPQDCKPQ
jgi:EipB-like